LSYLLKNR